MDNIVRLNSNLQAGIIIKLTAERVVYRTLLFLPDIIDY
uniref:Uncharacterized protein n=1 Tax=uncultured Desulfobacterium sp. TaxID=201089 RepID=E1Y858_9BACT|nr:unknown protein [uncultured Desulfobacterium sp.]